jgi:hypothetical protein
MAKIMAYDLLVHHYNQELVALGWNYYIRQDIELNEYYCKLLT